MKKLGFITYILLSTLCSNNSGAQERLEQKTVTAYTTGSAQDNHSKVRDIFRDEFGVIWIATENGCEMFDGWRCDRLGRLDEHGLISRNVSTVCGDKNGHLYFRFKNILSIYEYKTEAFKTYENMEISSATYFGALYVTTKKQVMRMSEDGKESEVMMSFDEESPDCISSLCFDSNGNMFISTDNNKIIKYDKDRSSSSFHVTGLQRVVPDDRGNTWVCSNTEGLIRIGRDGKTQTFKIKSDDINACNVTDICQISRDLYLVSTYAGLFSFNTTTEVFCRITLDTNSGIYSDTPILRLYKDKGYVIMGTISSGIIFSSEIIMDLTEESNLTLISGSDTPDVNAMAADNKGRVWLATIKGIKIIPTGDKPDNGANLQHVIKRISGLNQPISNIWTDNDRGHVLAATSTGIARISTLDGSVSWVKPDSISGLAENYRPSRTGEYLISDAAGVYRFDGSGNKLEETVNGRVLDFCEDKTGKIWISRSQSVQCSDNFHSSDVTIWPYDRIKGMSPKYDVTKILTCEDGMVCLGTNGCGLFILTPSSPEFKKLGYNEGLEDEHINDIVQSPDMKTIYVATDAGLSILDLKSEKITNLDKRHGVAISGASSLCMASDSTLLISAHNGIIKMTIGKEFAKPAKNRIKIKDYYINGERLRPGEGSPLKRSALYNDDFTTDWRTKAVKFRLANDNLSQSNPRGFPFLYMLQGLDKDFIKSESMTLDFHNLNPGHYTLIVKTLPDEGEEQYTSSVSFHIKAPYWKRIWFKMLVLALFGFLIYQIMASYRKYLNMESALEIEKNNTAQEKAYADMKSEFTENITHEFRTPLTLINNYLESLMLEDNLSRAAKENVSGIHRNSEKLNNMIDEIINMNQDNFNYLKPSMSPCDLSELLSDTFAQYDDLASRRNIDFVIKNAPKDTYINANYDHLGRAVSNLLSNAFKYTRSTVILSFREDDGYYLISVKDNGCGIREESIPHIFERFWTEKNNTNLGRLHGFGIGLSYAKNIVEVHGGELEVSSIPGEETKFTIRFRKEHISCTPSLSIMNEENNSEDQVANANEMTEKHLVLLVEDNKELMSLLVRAFSPKYEILKAYNSSNGLAIARQRLPDIIISDLIMPGMNGSELCREIKSDPMICHIPVFLLSAMSSNEKMLQSLNDGAEDVIIKPFKAEVLLAKVANTIKYREMIHEKYQHDATQDESMLPENEADSGLIKRIMSIVENNIFNQKFDIDSFAKEMCISRPVLYRKIKAVTGMTPNNFILSIKLKKAAAEMRNNPDLSVASAASKYGFCSTSYFIKCFKKQFNETPLSYRNRTS